MKEHIAFLKKRKSLLFILFGLIALVCLIRFLDIDIIIESFKLVGFKIFLVFATALLWIPCNTYCTSILLRHKVSFRNLLYTQVTGDAYNVITPFAGLGGEPYKIRHLTKWLPLSEVSVAIVRDRLIHSLSGIIYASGLMFTVVLFVTLEQQYFITFTAIGIVLAVIATLFASLILSEYPNKALSKILEKIQIIATYRNNPLTKKLFVQVLFFKLLGRALNLFEFWVIFELLGITPSLMDLIVITAMLNLSSTLLFIVPQGIGVNEIGISGGFRLIGYSLELGMSVALIRRARVLFWALLGVSLHVGYLSFRSKKLVLPSANAEETSTLGDPETVNR